MAITIEKILTTARKLGASDVHLVGGIAPAMRIHGEIRVVDGPPMQQEDLKEIFDKLLNDAQKTTFEREWQVCFSRRIEGIGRFRISVYLHAGSPEFSIRLSENQVRSSEELKLPEAIDDLCRLTDGLILITGPTGMGKTTTLNYIINMINATRRTKIITIEDPVEYVHDHQTALVSQREVGTDVMTFAEGLRAALREDPDVILLGEMRDLESISITLTLAETGHLVFATLHTNDASQAIDRIIDSYPAERRDQIQTQLSAVLQGVVSQRLAKRIGGGRVAAFEVLIANEAIRNLIREGKTRQIRNVIATSAAEGMQTLEASLNAILAAGLCTYDEILALSQYPKEIQNQAMARLANTPPSGRR